MAELSRGALFVAELQHPHLNTSKYRAGIHPPRLLLT